MKILYVVLDGAPDGFSQKKTSLSEAYKPNIDKIARRSFCGLVYTVGKGVAPESDAATMSLLGYDPHKYYTGRGPLEAMGVGIKLREGYEVALRSNFATIDPVTRKIIDRRVGRNLSSDEAKLLGEAVDNMHLDSGEGYARFRATIGHRGVLVLGHKKHKINAMISNTDPAYDRKGLISIALKDFEPEIKPAKPLEESKEARLAAKLLNEFTEKAIEVLDKHPVNAERRRRGLLPANAILSRDAGDTLPKVKSISDWTGYNWAAIAEMPVERGIARAIGMGILEIEVSGKDKASLLKEEANLVMKGFDKYDAIYAHLKGPDEPGHDGDLEGKKKAIELIDEYFFSPLMPIIESGEAAVIITSDHSTPWYLKAHSDDPVPLAIHVPGKHGDSLARFDEQTCKNGSLGLISGGYNIIPTALRLIKLQ